MFHHMSTTLAPAYSRQNCLGVDKMVDGLLEHTPLGGEGGEGDIGWIGDCTDSVEP